MLLNDQIGMVLSYCKSDNPPTHTHTLILIKKIKIKNLQNVYDGGNVIQELRL